MRLAGGASRSAVTEQVDERSYGAAMSSSWERMTPRMYFGSRSFLNELTTVDRDVLALSGRYTCRTIQPIFRQC